jgi:integrase
MTRSIFKHGFETDLIERPVKFGPMFRCPHKQDRRKAKAKHQQANGKKLFAVEDIRRMLDAAEPQMKAMILLGINCGFGKSDCAGLPLASVNLKTGWLDFARIKTGVERRCPLGPETIAALQVVIAARRQPVDDADADLIFITRCGQRWVRFDLTETKPVGKKTVKGILLNPLASRFSKMLNTLGLKRPGVGFYALRHSFETIAGGSRDQVAVDAIMGHTDNSMAAEYRHGIEDARLLAVVNHVHQWLFPP